jgi:hypothetical protein
MVVEQGVQFSNRFKLAAYLVFGIALSALFLLGTQPLFEPVGSDVSHRSINTSASMAMMFWCLSWPIIVLARGVDQCYGRLPWTIACVLLLLHIAIAFHVGHGWSLHVAWEHTRSVGGYGDGLYINFAFAVVWLLDVLWMWISVGSYLRRPRWLHRWIHLFLAFIVFNAAVIFADWRFRVTFLLQFLFCFLGILLVRRHMNRGPPPAAVPTAERECP